MTTAKPGYIFEQHTYCLTCVLLTDIRKNNSVVCTKDGECWECGDKFKASCKNCLWYNLTEPMIGDYCSYCARYM